MSLNKVNYVDGQTIISAQNMNDIQDEVIRLGEKEVVQSDWLEQDENSLAYVKNKPFSANLGQHRITYNIDEDVTDSDLIEVTVNGTYSSYWSGTYYLFNVGSSYMMEQELIRKVLFDQRVAFEYSDGSYSTLYDMYSGIGTKLSLLEYGFDNPNIIGAIYFNRDVASSPERGVVVIENSTDSDISKGIYICFNSQKKSDIKKVLENFYSNSSLSTIEMPFGVNCALYALEGVRYPLQPALESAMESLNNVTEALDNKVDKVGNKVLSDVNFTKYYESQVKNISDLQSRVYNLEQYHDPDYADQEVLKQSAIMIANEIAVNPYGVYLNTLELLDEYAKFMSGQTSDKIFMVVPGSKVLFVKMSDKTPTKEDFKKGFSIVMAYPDTVLTFPVLKPQTGLMIPNIAFAPEIWEMFGNDSVFMDMDEVGSFILSDAVIIAQEGNPMGLPKGLYVPASFEMLILGLQINGFNLNASSAPVSQEQLGDISSILDSIIGEQVWTFTLEDGSTVDKVVISSD